MSREHALTHNEANALLGDYIANELSEQARILVEQHLSTCELCQIDYREIRRIYHLLGTIKTAAEKNVAPSLADAVLLRLDTTPTKASEDLNRLLVGTNDEFSEGQESEEKIRPLFPTPGVLTTESTDYAQSRYGQEKKHTHMNNEKKAYGNERMYRMESRAYTPNRTKMNTVWVTLVAVLVLAIVAGSLFAFRTVLFGDHNTGPTRPGITTPAPKSTPTAKPTPTSKVTPNATSAATLPLEQQSIYVASNDGTVSALNASTGAVRWNYHSQGQLNLVSGPHDGDLKTPLTLSNGVLYIASSVGVEAVDARSGSMLWQARTGLNQSLVIVDDGVVYTDDTESLLALNAKDGKVLWSKSGSAPYSVLAVSDGIVYANTNNQLSAFNTADGKFLWQHNLLLQFWAVANSKVYLVDMHDGGFITLSAHDGSLLWQSSSTPFGLVQNTVYTNNNGYVDALDATNGNVMWQSKESFSSNISFTELVNGVIYAITSQNAVVALNAADGSLLWTSSAFDSHVYLEGEINGTLSVFYWKSGSGDGLVAALNTQDGSLKWSTELGYTTELLTTTATARGAIYMTTDDIGTDNTISAFSTSDGSLLWHYSQPGQYPWAVLE